MDGMGYVISWTVSGVKASIMYNPNPKDHESTGGSLPLAFFLLV